MAARGIKVAKFGGTSMGSAEAIQQVVSIVSKEYRDARPVRGKTAQRSADGGRTSNGASIVAVVVSAMSGVTDQLIKIAVLASKKDFSYKELLAALETRHIETVEKLVSARNRSKARAEVEKMFRYLSEAVQGIRHESFCE